MEPDSVELLKPKVSEELAISLALQLYGLKVTSIKRMVSFDDQNFHIKVSDQHQNPYIQEVLQDGYTLKVTNTYKSSLKGHFDAMHSMFIHLNEKGLRAPYPIKHLNGGTWVLEKVPLLNAESLPGEHLCGIHLLSFVPGVAISTVPYTSDLLRQWGLLLAKLHIATESLTPPALVSKDFFWKLEHVPEVQKYMEGLNSARTKLVLSVLDKYPEEITKNMEKLPKGLIHGDFNENNVLVQVVETEKDEKRCKVEGILDLEDMHFGTYVWDIGMMMAYALLDCKTMDPLDGAGHVLAGYLSIRKLSDLEKSLLKMCMECRLCQSLVICAHIHKNDPSNSYLLTSAGSGWARLEQLLPTSNNDLLRRWIKIEEEYFS